MLRSDLCDYSDAYIVLKGTLDLLAAAINENDKAEKEVAFKDNALFRSCISKINDTFIGNAEDLEIFMPMYNLLEYSDNYSMTSGSGIIIEKKFKMLMIMLLSVNHLNIRQK